MKEQIIKKETELANCNYVKAILMLIIVLYHSMVMYAGDGSWSPVRPAAIAPFIGFVALWLNTFCVYVFTLVSGYLFYYVKYERGGYAQYIPFLVNKSKRLLVPYLFIATVWVVPVYMFYYGTDRVIQNFVFGLAPNQLWFLLMLFWLFVMFWFISDLANKHIGLGAVIVCFLFVLGMFVPNLWCIARGMKFMIFFYLGFVIRKLNLGNRLLYRIPSIIYILCSILLFVVLEFFDENILGAVPFLGDIATTLLQIAGSVGFFVVLQKLVSHIPQNDKVARFLSKHSMVIYLIHQQLIYFSISWFNEIVPPGILVLINFAFSLAVSSLIAVILSKSRITRFLVGSN